MRILKVAFCGNKQIWLLDITFCQMKNVKYIIKTFGGQLGRTNALHANIQRTHRALNLLEDVR